MTRCEVVGTRFLALEAPLRRVRLGPGTMRRAGSITAVMLLARGSARGE